MLWIPQFIDMTFWFFFHIIVQHKQQQYFDMLSLKTKMEYLDIRQLYKLRKCMPFCTMSPNSSNSSIFSEEDYKSLWDLVTFKCVFIKQTYKLTYHFQHKYIRKNINKPFIFLNVSILLSFQYFFQVLRIGLANQFDFLEVSLQKTSI